MWLWNRWLGQPTKREADKNKSTQTQESTLPSHKKPDVHAHTY